jgi:Zn-dependent protease with chaperone function
VTSLLVAGLIVVTVAGVVWLVLAIGPLVVLRAYEAIEAPPDRAPLAYGLLDELTAVARVARPRLFVLPGSTPNGFVVAGERDRAVAVTEGVFERLDRDQLRGLFALLVARVARPRARAETAIAALALLLSPLILPSIALAHLGLPGRRWYEVDRSAAGLAGANAVVAALEGLTAAGDGQRDVPGTAASALCCVRPANAASGLAGAFATQPSLKERVERVRRQFLSEPRR